MVYKKAFLLFGFGIGIGYEYFKKENTIKEPIMTFSKNGTPIYYHANSRAYIGIEENENSNNKGEIHIY
jgi:hypothetical protein